MKKLATGALVICAMAFLGFLSLSSLRDSVPTANHFDIEIKTGPVYRPAASPSPPSSSKAAPPAEDPAHVKHVFVYSLNANEGAPWTAPDLRDSCSTGVQGPDCPKDKAVQQMMKTFAGMLRKNYPAATIKWSNTWHLYEYGLNASSRGVAVAFPGPFCSLFPVPNMAHVPLVVMAPKGAQPPAAPDMYMANISMGLSVGDPGTLEWPRFFNPYNTCASTCGAAPTAADHPLPDQTTDASVPTALLAIMEAAAQTLPLRDVVLGNWVPTNEKRVIAMSLYLPEGDKARAYIGGAQRSIRRSLELYPGWVSRIYHDSRMTDAQKAALNETGNVEFVEVLEADMPGDKRAWRFMAADDPTVHRMISRDSDAWPTLREVAAVQDWIQSGLPVHVMHDHPRHNKPFMAGMWGVTGGQLKNLTAEMREYFTQNAFTHPKTTDQTFLVDYFRSHVDYTTVLSHAAHRCTVSWARTGYTRRSFPTQRLGNYAHVGDVWDLDADGNWQRLTSWPYGPYVETTKRTFPGSMHCFTPGNYKCRQVGGDGAWIRG